MCFILDENHFKTRYCVKKNLLKIRILTDTSSFWRRCRGHGDKFSVLFIFFSLFLGF